MNKSLIVAQQRQHWMAFIICFLLGVFGGLSSTLLPSYLSQITEESFIKNVDKSGAIINSIFIYGMLAGGILLGYLSDKFGRRFGVLMAGTLLSIFTLVTSFAGNFWMLIVFRFLSGCGVGGILLTTTILLAEIWPEDKKSVILGILSICFPIGIFSAGLITYNVPEWRAAFLVGIIPMLILVPAYFLIPESAAWKLNPAKAGTPVLKIDIRAVIKGSIIYGSMLIGLWAIFAWLPSWIGTLVKNGDGQKEIGIGMMVLASGSVLAGFFSGWLCKKFNTKTIMLWCFGGCFVSAMLLFRFTSQLNIFTYLCIASIAVFFGISQVILNVYIPSLFETGTRSSGTGISFNISRLFTATVVFFIGWLLKTLGGINNALFIFSFVFLIGFFECFSQKTRSE